MRRILIVLVSAGVLAGCGRKDDEAIAADTLSRDIQLPKPDSTVALNDVPAAPTRTDTVYLPPPRPPGGVPPACAPADGPPPCCGPRARSGDTRGDPAASRLVAGTLKPRRRARSPRRPTNPAKRSLPGSVKRCWPATGAS